MRYSVYAKKTLLSLNQLYLGSRSLRSERCFSFLRTSSTTSILTSRSFRPEVGCQLFKIKRNAEFSTSPSTAKRMAPIAPGEEDLQKVVQDHINNNKVFIFSKTTCPFCMRVKDLFKSLNVEFNVMELDQMENGAAIQNTLEAISGQRTVPNVYINQTHLGGADATLKAHSENKLLPMINPSTTEYDYDLIVVGGGSGGLAAAKEAALLGRKVACLDFVKPSPQGTSWGLGGTCVNVGCIPKKLMHQAALLGHSLEEAKKFGWEVDSNGKAVKHNWDTMRNGIQDYIASLNWNYRVQLRNKNVTYINAYGEFVDSHKLKCTNKRGKEQFISADKFIIATGGRPKYPDYPGAEYCITSDDLFSLPYCPGKTLVVGASYVSLECAGFLRGLGLDVTIMVRSILLRGFDQQMAEKIGDFMKSENIKFVRPCVPSKIEKLEDGKPGRYRVTGKMNDGEEFSDEFNTILVAVGRDPCTKDIGLDNIGVMLNKSGFIVADDCEQTSVPNVYAVGDVLEGRPELTPVAIQAGRLLAHRLYGGTALKTDYVNVPTTVFTPLEYGCIGYSEEDAINKFGENDIEVYHSNFWPLEWTVPGKRNDICYAKLICVKSQKEQVVGFHVVGPNAGEITQGWTVGMKLGATKVDFDNSIGIHPTCAEIFTTMGVTKASGGDIAAAGC